MNKTRQRLKLYLEGIVLYIVEEGGDVCVIIGIFAHLLLSNRMEFGRAGPNCEDLFTHRRERGRLMPSGLAEKQTPSWAIRDTPAALLPVARVVEAKQFSEAQRLFFSPFDYSSGKPGFLFLFFSFVPLSVIVREIHYCMWQSHSPLSPWQGQRQMKCSDYPGLIIQYLQYSDDSA